MTYLLAAITAILFSANVYASQIILRSKYSEKAQKIMQLGFVWLLPFIGAVLAVSILKESRNRSTFDRASREMVFEEAWNYQDHTDISHHHH